MFEWLQNAEPWRILLPVGVLVVVAMGVSAALEGGGGDPPPESEPVAADTPEPVATTEPEPTEAATTPEPSPSPSPEPVAPVTVEGSDGNTAPFELPAGRVTVDIVTEGNCYFGFVLRTLEDRHAADLPSLDGEGTKSGELYGLDGGEYFLKPYTGSSCTWAVTFTPVG